MRPQRSGIFRGNREHTVIIAMTANALRGDRDRALAAGMDDYIAKPINQRELAALIGEWSVKIRGNGNGSHIGARAGADEPEAVSNEIVDGKRLAELRELARDEEPHWLSELVHMYVADAENRITSMREAAAAGQAAEVGRLAHALKGSSRNLGVLNVVPACQALQLAGEAGDQSCIAAQLQELQSAFAQARAELERLYETKGIQ